ncbi:MAG: DNA polymerase IV [Cellulosilyticaceae bacterium]
MKHLSDTVIFHVDVNAAFLSWEAAYRIKILEETVDLRTIPSAVGGDVEKRRGIILAKSVAAKYYGIQTGEPVVHALSKCPNLKIVKPNYALYTQCSDAFITLLKEYTPLVEQYSIDEAYMDMTGTEGLYGSPVAIANVIKNRIYNELGFTVNIGISSNKLLAKMAGDLKKPNLVHTLFPNEIKDKMWPLPVGDLFFVGSATEKKLKKLGIKTIGELAQTDINLLKSHLKKQGEVIHCYANGIDVAAVNEEKASNKGYGNSTTIPFDVSLVENANLILLSLCETVSARLRADNVKAGCVCITLVDTYFEHYTRQKTLIAPTNITEEIYEHACKILIELWNQKVPIRQIGVHTSKLSDGKVHQYNLFDTQQYEKYEKLNKAIDQIRDKFGEDSVIRAPFLGSKLDHMAGGSWKDNR